MLHTEIQKTERAAQSRTQLHVVISWSSSRPATTLHAALHRPVAAASVPTGRWRIEPLGDYALSLTASWDAASGNVRSDQGS
jgi:hypothetical protein